MQNYYLHFFKKYTKDIERQVKIMSVYALSDLHLYKSIKDKPMDIFGPEWDNHMDKLKAGCEILTENDVLLIPGDVSWAMYLNEAYEDFKFIEEIPGKKIISKGNHDYWWESHKKINAFVKQCGFTSLSFLHNNFFEYNGVALCGNKGYFYNPSAFTEEASNPHDKLLYERELLRMELSLKMASDEGFSQIIFQTHYPPTKNNLEPDEIVMELFDKYGVTHCVYGHLHAHSQKNKIEGVFGSTEFVFASCEYLGFVPKLIL